MRSKSLLLTAACLLGASLIAAVAAAQQAAPADSQPSPEQIAQMQQYKQILQQIVQHMTPEQQEALKKLPPDQQKAVLMELLKRVIAKAKAKADSTKIKEWLEDDKDTTVVFREPDLFPDTAEKIEDYVFKKTERRVKVLGIAFIREGHDHFFHYKRLYRAKLKTEKDDKEHVIDFLMEKEGPYLKIKEWRRPKETKS